MLPSPRLRVCICHFVMCLSVWLFVWWDNLSVDLSLISPDRESNGKCKLSFWGKDNTLGRYARSITSLRNRPIHALDSRSPPFFPSLTGDRTADSQPRAGPPISHDTRRHQRATSHLTFPRESRSRLGKREEILVFFWLMWLLPYFNSRVGMHIPNRMYPPGERWGKWLCFKEGKKLSVKGIPLYSCMITIR